MYVKKKIKLRLDYSSIQMYVILYQYYHYKFYGNCLILLSIYGFLLFFLVIELI